MDSQSRPTPTSEIIEVPVLLKGNRKTQVSIPSDGNSFAHLIAALGQAGFSAQQLEGLILWPSEADMKSRTGVALPVPKPTSPDDVLPTRSSERTLSVGAVDDVYINTSELTSGSWFPVKKFRHLLVPAFPEGALIRYTIYWQKVKSWRLGPGTFERDVVHRIGTTRQDSTTVAAELGVAGELLSLKLSATLNHSVSITEETETSERYSFVVPAQKICIFTIWNLVHDFQFTDAAGNPLNWSGIMRIGMGATPGFAFPKSQLINPGADVAQDPVLFDA